MDKKTENGTSEEEVGKWTKTGTWRRKERIETQRARTGPVAPILGLIAGSLVGNNLALQAVGEAGWADETVSLLFAFAGAEFAHGFFQRLCDQASGKMKGVFGVGAGGLSLGIGIAGLTVAPLLSWLDGGIITASVVVPVSTKLVMNSRGGKKVCPRCHSETLQSCNHAACRECLRVFFPRPVPDCDKKFFLDWPDVASYLDRQGLNYLEALRFITAHFRLPVKSGRVECEAFMKWAKTKRDAIRDAQGTITSSDQSTWDLKAEGL